MAVIPNLFEEENSLVVPNLFPDIDPNQNVVPNLFDDVEPISLETPPEQPVSISRGASGGWGEDEEDRIGFNEEFLKKPPAIPFDPRPAYKIYQLYKSSKRLQADEYLDENKREDDRFRVSEYLKDIAEEQRRGKTIPAKVYDVVSQMPAYMSEFLLTGGLASLGKKGAVKGLTKLLGTVVKKRAGRLAVKGIGWGVSGGLRAAQMPHRVAESVIGRRIPEGMQLTEEGKFITEGVKESPFTSAWKGFGDVWIEMMSEEAGAGITKGMSMVARKVPFINKAMRKLGGKWIGLGAGRTMREFNRKIGTATGYHGVLEEMGEERLGDFMRAVTGIQDFGAGEGATIFDRVIASIPKAEQLLVEGIAFSIPGVARAGAGMLIREGKPVLTEPTEPIIKPTEPTPITKPITPTVKAPVVRPKIITDPVEVQKIKDSIAEGQLILKAGTSHGRKLSKDELLSVRKSVENSLAKIGESRIPAKALKQAKEHTMPAKSLKIGDMFLHPSGEVYKVIPTPKDAPANRIYIQDGKKRVLAQSDDIHLKGAVNDPLLVGKAGMKIHGEEWTEGFADIEVKIKDVAIKGRLRKLDADNKIILRQIDSLEIQRKRFIKHGLSTKSIDNKIQNLVKRQEKIDIQRGDILIDQRAKINLAKEKIEIKPEKIEKIAISERIKGISQGLQRGTIKTREQIKASQTEIIELLEQSNLEAVDKAKFIRAIKNIQTQQQLIRQLPIIQKRIATLETKATSRKLKWKIRSELRKFKVKKDKVGRTSVEYEMLKTAFNKKFFDGVKLRTQAQNEELLSGIQTNIESYDVNNPANYEDFVLYALLSQDTKGLNEMATDELGKTLDTILQTRQIARDSFLMKQIDRAKDIRQAIDNSVDNMQGHGVVKQTFSNRMTMNPNSYLDRQTQGSKENSRLVFT